MRRGLLFHFSRFAQLEIAANVTKPELDLASLGERKYHTRSSGQICRFWQMRSGSSDKQSLDDGCLQCAIGKLGRCYQPAIGTRLLQTEQGSAFRKCSETAFGIQHFCASADADPE